MDADAVALIERPRERWARAAAIPDASARDTAVDPEGEALERERAHEVREVLSRIPRAQAALLALRYSGLSYSEVAVATGTKIDQVGTRLRRAHDAFRKEVLRGQHR